jgi:hypothetical protein
MNMNALEASMTTTAQSGHASMARNIILAYENRKTGNAIPPRMIATGRIARAKVSKGFSMPHLSNEKGAAQ